MAETLAGAGHVLCVDGDPGAHRRRRGFVHLADISETAVGWDSGLEWRPAAASCFCGGEEASAHGRARGVGWQGLLSPGAEAPSRQVWPPRRPHPQSTVHRGVQTSGLGLSPTGPAAAVARQASSG